VLTAPSRGGAQKLGQPVPLSNLVSDEKRLRPHPAQAKMSVQCSFRSALENGNSVQRRRNTAYWAGVRRWRQSASLRVTSKASDPA